MTIGRYNRNQGGLVLIGTDFINGIHYPIAKLAIGAENEEPQLIDPADGLPTKEIMGGVQLKTLHRYLSTGGDGTVDNNAIGDYSAGGLGQTIFKIQPAAGEIFLIARLLVTIQDANNTGKWDRYGGEAELTNGITMRVQDDAGTINDLTDGIPIVSNAFWSNNCFDSDLKSIGGGNDFLQARWTFTQAGTFIRLIGDNNERLEAVMSDNLSGLAAHFLKVDGLIEQEA